MSERNSDKVGLHTVRIIPPRRIGMKNLDGMVVDGELASCVRDSAGGSREKEGVTGVTGRGV